MTLPEAAPARCRPGDLAMVIRAHHPENMGRIVRVTSPERGQSGYRFPWPGPTWWVEVEREPMLWLIAGRPHAMYHGPVADCCLQPICGPEEYFDIAF